jgi:hypothetical protein
MVRTAVLSGSGSIVIHGNNGFLPNIPGNCTDTVGGVSDYNRADVALPSFPALGSVTFVVNCNVTATGAP